MLKPIRWNTFIRDFIVIQIGFGLFGLSIAAMIRSNCRDEFVGGAGGGYLQADRYHAWSDEYHRWLCCLIGRVDPAREDWLGNNRQYFVYWSMGRFIFGNDPLQ
ncbi:MAG: hypothetical protein QM730_10285 [Anaerolineales bacterium]